MRIGTKTVLYGYHCFFIHPWFVLAAWIKLYGFPWDPRLWVAFFVHDLGYFGKVNIDGAEGETHVEFGAELMHLLFDRYETSIREQPVSIGIPIGLQGGESICDLDYSSGWPVVFVYCNKMSTKWRDLCLFHSRFYAEKKEQPVSKLCIADKYAFALTPRWLTLLLTKATGEIWEYMARARSGKYSVYAIGTNNAKEWHKDVKSYMSVWIEENKSLCK